MRVLAVAAAAAAAAAAVVVLVGGGDATGVYLPFLWPQIEGLFLDARCRHAARQSPGTCCLVVELKIALSRP